MESGLCACVARVCDYLDTEDGKRELRSIMATPYKHSHIGYVGAVAQIVVLQCPELLHRIATDQPDPDEAVIFAEELSAVTDEVVIKMLGVEREEVA